MSLRSSIISSRRALCENKRVRIERESKSSSTVILQIIDSSGQARRRCVNQDDGIKYSTQTFILFALKRPMTSFLFHRQPTGKTVKLSAGSLSNSNNEIYMCTMTGGCAKRWRRVNQCGKCQGSYRVERKNQ